MSCVGNCDTTEPPRQTSARNTQARTLLQVSIVSKKEKRGVCVCQRERGRERLGVGGGDSPTCVKAKCVPSFLAASPPMMGAVSGSGSSVSGRLTDLTPLI